MLCSSMLTFDVLQYRSGQLTTKYERRDEMRDRSGHNVNALPDPAIARADDELSKSRAIVLSRSAHGQ